MRRAAAGINIGEDLEWTGALESAKCAQDAPLPQAGEGSCFWIGPRCPPGSEGLDGLVERHLAEAELAPAGGEDRVGQCGGDRGDRDLADAGRLDLRVLRVLRRDLRADLGTWGFEVGDDVRRL